MIRTKGQCRRMLYSVFDGSLIGNITYWKMELPSSEMFCLAPPVLSNVLVSQRIRLIPSTRPLFDMTSTETENHFVYHHSMYYCNTITCFAYLFFCINALLFFLRLFWGILRMNFRYVIQCSLYCYCFLFTVHALKRSNIPTSRVMVTPLFGFRRSSIICSFVKRKFDIIWKELH